MFTTELFISPKANRKEGIREEQLKIYSLPLAHAASNIMFPVSKLHYKRVRQWVILVTTNLISTRFCHTSASVRV